MAATASGFHVTSINPTKFFFCAAQYNTEVVQSQPCEFQDFLYGPLLQIKRTQYLLVPKRELPQRARDSFAQFEKVRGRDRFRWGFGWDLRHRSVPMEAAAVLPNDVPADAIQERASELGSTHFSRLDCVEEPPERFLDNVVDIRTCETQLVSDSVAQPRLELFDLETN